MKSVLFIIAALVALPVAAQTPGPSAPRPVYQGIPDPYAEHQKDMKEWYAEQERLLEERRRKEAQKKNQAFRCYQLGPRDCNLP